jgi:hypothetical protein
VVDLCASSVHHELEEQCREDDAHDGHHGANLTSWRLKLSRVSTGM